MCRCVSAVATADGQSSRQNMKSPKSDKEGNRMRLFRICFVLALVAAGLGSVEAKIVVYEPTGWAQSSLARVSYRVNSDSAYLTVTIYPSDVNGNPTGPLVQSETYYSETKGYHDHLYYGLAQDTYVAIIEATGVNETQWRPIEGIFKYNDPTVEYPPPNPAVPDLEGWYGVGINTRAESPYFGYIYVPHKSYQDIYMYRGDGSFIRTMDDSAVYWGASAPWDAYVADDDYVYIGDRSSRLVYCFKPDGSGVMSVSPPITYSRALFARTDPSGITHIYVTGGFGSVYEVTVQPDHTTWGTPVILATLGAGLSDDNFKIGGLWVNETREVMYVCYDGEVHKYTRSGSTWSAAGSPWPVPVPAAFDVDMSPDGSTLWVASSSASNAIRKVDAATGAVTPMSYGIVTWGHMVKTDAVGNVAFTYGKSPTTWAQYYWALFTEPGPSTYNTKTNTFTTTADHLPVMTFYAIQPTSVPGDDTTTATLTAWVYDDAGWEDLQEIRVDLDPVGITEDIISTDKTQNLSDPTNRSAIFTVPGLKAAVGAEVAIHDLPITIVDTSGSSQDIVQLSVTGTEVTFTVRHNETSRPVPNSFVRATGGMPGLPGYPFTYNCPLADSNGVTTMQLSRGTYDVQAVKAGYGSLDPVEITVGETPMAVDLYLRPCSLAEVRALPDSTLCNVKGVVYAQTCGPYTLPSPPAVLGLAERKDMTSYCYQWYLCDPDDPNNGILMLFPVPPDPFSAQMDDPSNPGTYVGPRPVVGDTVMATGMLATPGGHERRVRIDTTLPYKEDIYQNYGNIGGLPVVPIGLTIPEFMHENISTHPSWGKYAMVMSVMVVKNVPDGEPSDLGDPVPYAVIADVSSGNLAELVIETPLTLGVGTWPTPGASYTFQGPIGRRNRYGNGCIRIRGESDIMLSEIPPPRGSPVGTVRDLPDGSFVNIEGIVTGVWATTFYIESADRSSGIRVNADVGYYVQRGDIAQVQGVLGITDGERAINPTMPVLVHGTAPVPGVLGLRNRDLGGAGTGPDNPGVTDGRGALNVGLLVKVTGTVTRADIGYFYIHDGSNRTDQPLDDGSGYYGVRITSNAGATVGERIEVTGVSTTDTWNVPGRNIPTIMPRDDDDIVRNPALSAVSSPPGTVVAGWNLLAVPGIPGDPDPEQVFSGISVDARLYRWEAATASLIVYDMWMPQTYGGVLIGDGAWLDTDSPATISYQGRLQPDDQWITLPLTGWTLIGQPFDHNTYWSDVKVHNGKSVATMEDACRIEGWMQSMGYWWENSTQSLSDIGLPDDWPSSEILLAWHGYWVQSNVDNLSLIIPASPAAP